VCFLLLSYRCTLWYRTPELLMCERVYLHKIDEWSVGCVLLEMVIGVPPFRWKPKCRCQCPQVTHKNFNSDQLARIFVVTGSPSDKMVMRPTCQAHIRGWPKAPRKLERTVEKMLTIDRFRLGETSAHSVTQAEMENAIGNWSSVIAAMLELDPVSRWTCSQAYEMLNRMLVADKRSPQQHDSMANVNNDTGVQFAGPQHFVVLPPVQRLEEYKTGRGRQPKAGCLRNGNSCEPDA
jgi:serine/threonine protein kinase